MSVRQNRFDTERGDTIIEVLFAMTVLAVVVTITISLMNAGFSGVMASTDRTNVQAIMSGQASLLRVAREQAAAGGDATGWASIKSTAPTGYAMVGNVGGMGVTPSSDGCTTTNSGGAAKRFYLEPTAPNAALPTTKAWQPVSRTASPSVRAGTSHTPGDGIWIEAYRFDPDGASPQPAYYDFYIKACWRGFGTTVLQQSKSVVRLYEI